MQTVPGFAKGMSDGLPKFISQEGVAGLYKGLVPLWGRQIPYTMMKFGACDGVSKGGGPVCGGGALGGTCGFFFSGPGCSRV